jgi:hypothetical protein
VRCPTPVVVKPEYSPAASQCQISTMALRTALHDEALTTVSCSVSGVPGLPSRTSWRSFSPAM